MTRRRRIGLRAAGLVGALAIAGCSGSVPGGAGSPGSNDAAPSGVTASRTANALRMVVADYGDGTREYWNTVVTGFEKAHPGVTVDLQLISWREIDAKVGVMVKNNQVPDLLETDSYASLATSGQLYQADEVLSGTVRDDLVGALRTAGSVDGVQYAVPFAARTHLLVYNKTLFSHAGLAAPTDWQDVADAANVLRGDVDTPYGMALAPASAQGDADDAATAEAAQWMLGNGATLTDGDGRLKIGGALEADALGWVRTNLVDAGLAGKDPAKTTESALAARFGAGKVGMMVADPATVRTLLAKPAGKGGAVADWGVVTMPGRGEPLPKSLTTTDWLMAFKKNGNQQHIKDFLEYAYAAPQQAALTASIGLLPTTGQGRDAVAADPARARLKPWLDALASATTYPTGAPGWPAVETVLREGVGPALTGGQTAPTEIITRLKQTATDAATPPANT